MKAMSIIGIVWFSLSLLIIIMSLGDNDANAAAGWGIIGLFYAIPYSITGLVVANKNMTAELIQLADLKDKGILTEEEFQVKKQMLI